MIDAVWTIELNSGDKDYSAGVLVLAEGRAFGGNAHACFVGDYVLANERVAMRLKVLPYNNSRPQDATYGGRGPYEIDLEGQDEETKLVLSGTVLDDAANTITMVARRQHELPKKGRGTRQLMKLWKAV